MNISRIGKAVIEAIPRWPRLALAARCLRRARDLVHPTGPAARVIDDAIERIDQAARTARSSDELEGAAAAAYTLALDHLDGERPGDDHDAVVRNCMLAHATAFACEAATLSDSHQAAHLVVQAIDFAIHVCRLSGRTEADAAVAAMRSDVERIARAADGWSDTSPVPPSWAV